MENNELGKTSMGMQANVAALLSYIGWIITGVIFYVLEKENKFVRFHAMQSMLTCGAFIVANVVLAFIPVVGWSLMPILSIIQVILWVILMVKAYQGERFKLPVVGDIAEKNA